MISLKDWKNQGSSIRGLVNPRSKQDAIEAAQEFDRVRETWIERVRPTVRATLQEIVSSVQNAARDVQRVDDLRTRIESTVTGARPIYKRSIETAAEDVSRDFYDRMLDALDGETLSHAEYIIKQNGEDRPPNRGPTQSQDEAPIGTAVGLFLAANVAVLVQAAHGTTKQIILSVLTEVINTSSQRDLTAEETIELFVDRITDSSVATRGRIKRIARTLVTRISNWAGLKAAKDHEEDWLKDWVSVRDDDVRPAHLDADLDQEPIPLDEFFSIGGFPALFPSDPRLPPDQSINCRCTLVFVSP